MCEGGGSVRHFCDLWLLFKALLLLLNCGSQLCHKIDIKPEACFMVGKPRQQAC